MCLLPYGLYTPQYKGIYGYFERNNFSDSLRDWYFRGFCDELSPKLRYIEPLPQKPVYHMEQSGINFNPEWPIRVNVNHILGDEENLERIPAKIRKVKNLPLLFETAVELGRRKSVIEPGLVVPQGYQGRVQYLLPVYLTNMQKPDLAMTLTVMDGYYLGNTCLTLEMEHCWWCSWTERRLNVKMKKSKKRCRLGVAIPDRLFFLVLLKMVK